MSVKPGLSFSETPPFLFFFWFSCRAHRLLSSTMIFTNASRLVRTENTLKGSWFLSFAPIKLCIFLFLYLSLSFCFYFLFLQSFTWDSKFFSTTNSVFELFFKLSISSSSSLSSSSNNAYILSLSVSIYFYIILSLFDQI